MSTLVLVPTPRDAARAVEFLDIGREVLHLAPHLPHLHAAVLFHLHQAPGAYLLHSSAQHKLISRDTLGA
jgi:hypothetical protein